MNQSSTNSVTNESQSVVSSSQDAPKPATMKGAVLVAGLTAVLLLPFLNKAFHIDDTLFLRLARQIQNDPLAPYDMDYIWFMKPEPFWKVTQNPPLNGYLIAAIGSIINMSEPVLHSFYLLMAIGCALLMYSLACRFCKHPVLATVLTIISPAFLVSASSVMADVPLLFFWLLAIWAAVRYTETLKPSMLWMVGVSASAAVMTKYFGIALVPLLIVYCMPRNHRSTGALFALLLPVAVLIAWGVYSDAVGDVFHPLGAARYSTELKERSQVTTALSGGRALVFLGGTLLWPVFLLPISAKLPRWLCAIVYLTAVGAVINESQDFTDMSIFVYWLTAVAGGALLLFAAESWNRHRNLDSVLLGLWFFGTMSFCAFFNWSVSARVILPCIFPAAVLVIRWVESFETRRFWIGWLWGTTIPVLVISYVIALADYEFAGAGRTFAQTTVRDYIKQGKTVIFAGHWGFQHYMEAEGARPLNRAGQLASSGDLIVYAFVNTSNHRFKPAAVKTILDTKDTYTNPYRLHTMYWQADCGFYSSSSGVLPFNLVEVRYADRFLVDRVIFKEQQQTPAGYNDKQYRGRR